jgi:hypothetical protein
MAPQQREPIPEGNYERGKKLFKVFSSVFIKFLENLFIQK